VRSLLEIDRLEMGRVSTNSKQISKPDILGKLKQRFGGKAIRDVRPGWVTSHGGFAVLPL
jgi:hypothetical protein